MSAVDLIFSTAQDMREVRAAVRSIAVATDVQVDDAVLAASELATNVLLHTAGGARLQAWKVPHRGALRVEVRDTVPIALPPLRLAAPTTASGRGLLIVDHLASRWGIYIHDGLGKTVWFEMAPPSQTSAHPQMNTTVHSPAPTPSARIGRSRAAVRAGPLAGSTR